MDGLRAPATVRGMPTWVRVLITLLVGFVVYRLVIALGDSVGDLLLSLAIGAAAGWGAWVLTRRWARRP